MWKIQIQVMTYMTNTVVYIIILKTVYYVLLYPCNVCTWYYCTRVSLTRVNILFILFSDMVAIHPIATLGRFATLLIVVRLNKFARPLFGRACLLGLHFLATASLVLFRGAFRLSVGQCWTCWTCWRTYWRTYWTST